MKYRFIDLFAGLGGFHQALSALGHQCVFACEIDEGLADLYEKNFGMRPQGDIRSIDPSSIPAHDILCAGFPCQPFSKAGSQQGFECPKWGDLIDYIIGILREHQPRFFIIENVPNLVRHHQGETYQKIQHRLRLAGYSVDAALLSPHQFGIPQIRRRAFIVGQRGGLSEMVWPEPLQNSRTSIRSILDKNSKLARSLPKSYVSYLNAWQKFLDQFPRDEKFPALPIWAMEFGATYPYSDRSPSACTLTEIQASKGALGQSLRGLEKRDALSLLPPYARGTERKLPEWKINFIRNNRELYKRHKVWIDKWLPSISEFAPSFQKFEWNCGDEKRSIWNHIVQFRSSGIRVKRTTTAPALVTVISQVPVIAWERRYMTIREGSRLQGMGKLKQLPASQARAFKALGNAVNVDVAKKVAERLLKLEAPAPGDLIPFTHKKKRGRSVRDRETATAA